MAVATAKEIGSRIRKMRQLRELSQLQLAQLAGTHQSNLSGWETGSRDIFAWSLARLALALHVSTDYFLGLTDDQDPVWQI